MTKSIYFNMQNFLNTLKVKYIRKTITAEGYGLQRLNTMNGKVQYWLLSQQHANTTAGRNYCNMMVDMYLRRYKYYINK